MRLDKWLVERGLVATRARAQRLIHAGRVRVDDHPVTKASAYVAATSRVEVDDDGYVSRSAHKLIEALDSAGVAVHGRAADCGASTGGFTQVLLERGAQQVYAIDVGHGQLDPVVGLDPRVEVLEGVNVRDVDLTHVGGLPVDVVVADLSFISLRLVLAPMLGLLTDDGIAAFLVKPQFEVGRSKLGSDGVVKDPRLQEQAVDDVVSVAQDLGWSCFHRVRASTTGESGNREWVIFLHRSGRDD